MGKDSLATIASAETAIGRPTTTARRLVDASVSTNTRRAYAGALGQLAALLDGRQLDDAALAVYLAEFHDAGRTASSAATAVAAERFGARLAGQAEPAGCSPATAERPATGTAVRSVRSALRTWRPCSPRATACAGVAAAPSPTKWPP